MKLETGVCRSYIKKKSNVDPFQRKAFKLWY